MGYPLQYSWAFLVAQTVKKSACSVEDLGSIPGLGRSPGEGNSYPLQYSGLKNSMDRGAWQATACLVNPREKYIRTGLRELVGWRI